MAGAGVVAALPTAMIGDRVPPPLRDMIVGPLMMGALADARHRAAPFLLAVLLGLLG